MQIQLQCSENIYNVPEEPQSLFEFTKTQDMSKNIANSDGMKNIQQIEEDSPKSKEEIALKLFNKEERKSEDSKNSGDSPPNLNTKVDNIVSLNSGYIKKDSFDL